jgi:hypothetical protein
MLKYKKYIGMCPYKMSVKQDEFVWEAGGSAARLPHKPQLILAEVFKWAGT